MVFHYHAYIHAHARDNIMKIKNTIILDIGYQEKEDLVIEISEDFDEYTNFIARENDESFKPIFSVPNNKLKQFVEAINEHIKIHKL